MEGTFTLKKEKAIQTKTEINKIYIYFIIFFLGCIVGFTYETILAIFHLGGLYNRQGLLIGPFVPVYGLGAVIFTIFLKNMKNKFDIFIIATLIGGIFEYLYSFFQEKIFGTVSWDYSTEFLNIDGRTSIIFAIFWGIIGVLYITYFYPTILEIIHEIPNRLFLVGAFLLSIFMSIDIFLTLITSFRQTQRYNGMEAKNSVDVFLDKYFNDEMLNNIYTNRVRKNN